VIESMTGARFVRDQLEERGWAASRLAHRCRSGMPMVDLVAA
jgi:Holliday junction resolvase